MTSSHDRNDQHIPTGKKLSLALSKVVIDDIDIK